MTSETPAQRLGRLVRARRKALKLTQADVQKVDGPSTATLRLIEGGKHTDFRGGTGASLESAIQWRPGSIDKILAGGDPITVESPEVNWINFNDPEAPEERQRAEGVWHVVSHTWSLADKVIEELRRSDPSPALVESVRRLVMVLGAYIAGQVMESDAPRQDRDRALAELYRRRDHADQLLRGELNAMEAAPQPSTSSEGDKIEEAGLHKPESPRSHRIGPHSQTGVPIQLPGEDGADQADVGN